MHNGIYKAEFAGNKFAYSGAVYLKDGRLSGCDDSYFYLGNYESTENKISATFKVNKHSSGANVTGIDNYTISVSGTPSMDSLTLASHSGEIPFAVKLTKVADLP